MLKEALGLNIQKESNIPEVEIEVVNQEPAEKPKKENQKVASNSKQVVA